MIIKSITINRLKAIREERTLEFVPGLNIIKGGDNEAGKSSTRIAITKALFEDPANLPAESDNLTSWGTEDPWEIKLEFEDHNVSYCITRSLKDKTSELVGKGSREFIARNRNSIVEKIAEITGCPSETFFVSTACIGQDELIRIIPHNSTEADISGAVGTITKRLQSKLSGTENGVDVPGILTKLYNQASYKDAGGPYYHLQETKEKIYNLREQILEEVKKVNDIISKRRSLSRVKKDLEEIERRLPARAALLEKNRKINQLEKEIARDKARYDMYLKAVEYHKRLDALEQELVPFAAFAGAGEQIEKMESLRNSAALLSGQAASLENDLRSQEKHKPLIWIPALALLLAVWGIIGGVMIDSYLWGAAAVGLLVILYWLKMRNNWKKQVNLISDGINEPKRQLAENEAERQLILAHFGCVNYDEYSQRSGQYRSLKEKRSETAGKMEILLNGRNWQAFAGENESLFSRTGADLEELEQIIPEKLDPHQLQELESEVSEMQKNRTRLEQEKGGLERYFLYMDVHRDSMIDIEEELDRLDEEREFWERKRKVYKATHEVLGDAYKQTLSKAADLLEKEISHNITIITDGRYNRVKVNETDMSLSTFSPEKDDWVDVTELSRGTQDQFYICARFALAKLITEGKRPPLLLDDPFVNFHTKRLRQVISLLKEIAEENQVLLFTCSDAYDYLGHVITLE